MAKTAITLKNAAVAAKYSTDRTIDPVVHVPSLYKGKLSNIPIEAADALVLQGSNLLALKSASMSKPNVKETLQNPTLT